MNYKIKINPLDYKIEKFIIKKLNFNPPESYAKIDKNELENIYQLILQKFSKKITNNFNKKIILSIRGNIMRSNLIINHKNIINNEYIIEKDYMNGFNILDLVKKYNYSPLNLLRIIFYKKYHNNLTKIIKNTKILDSRDYEQLNLAISNDIYALINQKEILQKSILFENKIQKILNKLNIVYKTQNELAKEQIKDSNIVTNTPDFLILSEFFINNKKISWIDAKNFYISDSILLKKKIIKQTNKYIDKYGSGAIISSLGFSSSIFFYNILLIDFTSFQQIC